MGHLMSDEELARWAEFYGITIDEARRRHHVMLEHTGDPNDPICVGCTRRPYEVPMYVTMVREGPDSPIPSQEEVARYVIEDEGTYNRENGHYLCDECYIKNGQPSSSTGWVCP